MPSAPKTAVEAPMDTWPPRATSAVSTLPATPAASASQRGERRTEPARHRAEEDADRDGVGDDVRQVRVQRQRGRSAPPLAIQHPRGVGAASLDEARCRWRPT